MIDFFLLLILTDGLIALIHHAARWLLWRGSTDSMIGLWQSGGGFGLFFVVVASVAGGNILQLIEMYE